MSTSAISVAIPQASSSAVSPSTKATSTAQKRPDSESVAVDQKSKALKATPDTSSKNIALAALQEATETAAQTAKEAGNGDRQAQKLLQKNAAAASNHASSGSAAHSVNTSGQITGRIISTKA